MAKTRSTMSPTPSGRSATPSCTGAMLVSWNRGSFTKSAHAGEDLIRRLQPDEGLGVFVAGGEVDADGVLELAGAAVRPAAQLLLGETGEPALDLVDPGRVGGREVHVEARVARQPAPDERCLVGPVVVDDQVHLQVGGDLGVDAPQELPELDRAVPAVRLADDLAAHDVERGEERGGAVATVVVAAPLGDAGSQGQGRLWAGEGLDLALIVCAR